MDREYRRQAGSIEKEAIAYIQRILATENFLYWVVRIKKESTPIGIISFLRRNYLQNFDIGFAFLPEFTGKGYAYEAAKAVLDMVTQQPGFNTVLALTLRTNKRSIKLLEKLGFTFVESSEMEGRRLEIFASAKRPNPN
ncbi:MAG: GNAT family N-acetyltransferase [Bacteroidota bacterium]|nr:GNAT family N-acetyltransferase [Bacteroidota bacterium]